MRRIILAALPALLLAGPLRAQTAPKIGPTFGTELAAAGCADGVTWTADGTVTLRPDVPVTVQACVAKVQAAHDPTKTPPRAVEVSDLLDALSVAQRASITADHMARLQARGAKGPVTAADTKVMRAAVDLGMTPDAWVALVPTGN